VKQRTGRGARAIFSKRTRARRRAQRAAAPRTGTLDSAEKTAVEHRNVRVRAVRAAGRVGRARFALLISGRAIDANNDRRVREARARARGGRMDLVAEPLPTTVSPARRRVGRTDKPALWRAFWKQPTDERRNRLVEAYQSPRQVRFEINAELRARGAVLDELRVQDWLPRPWRTRLDQRKRTLEELRGELGREPFDPEVAGAMGLSIAEYEHLFGTVLPGTPAGSMPVSEGGEELASRLDGVIDTRSGPPGEELTRTELLRLLAQRMSEQEYRIVYLKYWEDLSMREIGELTRLSESRVCKIHAKLLGRLKDRFRAQGSESPA
jgi:RNA polymerase sigma factor for flagellar operon FliA